MTAPLPAWAELDLGASVAYLAAHQQLTYAWPLNQDFDEAEWAELRVEIESRCGRHIHWNELRDHDTQLVTGFRARSMLELEANSTHSKVHQIFLNFGLDPRRLLPVSLDCL